MDNSKTKNIFILILFALNLFLLGLVLLDRAETAGTRRAAEEAALLLLDESTSALDNAAQEIVRKHLDSLRATRIVIAHRLSTIINADRIYVLEKGRVVQTGSYAELIAREGLFRRLVERQWADGPECAS